MDDPGRSSRAGSQSATPARATAEADSSRSRTPRMIGLRPRSIRSTPSTSGSATKRPLSGASTVSDGLLEQSQSPDLPTPTLVPIRPRFRQLPPPKVFPFVNTMKALAAMSEAGASVDANRSESSSSQNDTATPEIKPLRPRKRVPSTRIIAPIGSKLKEALALEAEKHNAAGPSDPRKIDLNSDDDDSDEIKTPAQLGRPRFVAQKDKRRSAPIPNLLKAFEAAKNGLDELNASSESESSDSPTFQPSKKRGKYAAARKAAAPAGQLASALEELRTDQKAGKSQQTDNGKRAKETETGEQMDSNEPEIPHKIPRPRYAAVKDKRRSVPKANLQKALDMADKNETAELMASSSQEESISPPFVPTRKRGAFRIREPVLPPGKLAAVLAEYKQEQELAKLQQKDNQNLVENAATVDQNALVDDRLSPAYPMSPIKRNLIAQQNLSMSVPTEKRSLITENHNTTRKKSMGPGTVSDPVDQPVPTAVQPPAVENLPDNVQDVSVTVPFQALSQSTPQTRSKIGRKAPSSRPPSHMSAVSVISAASTYLSLENTAEDEEVLANAVANAPEAANAGSVMFSNDPTASGSATNQMVKSAVAALEAQERESTVTDRPLESLPSTSKDTSAKQLENQGNSMVKKWTRPVSRSGIANTSRKEKTVAVVEDMEEEDFIVVEKNTTGNLNTTKKDKTLMKEVVEEMEEEDFILVEKSRTTSSNSSALRNKSFRTAIPVKAKANLTRSSANASFVAPKRSSPEEELIPQETSRSNQEVTRLSMTASGVKQTFAKDASKSVNKNSSQEGVNQDLRRSSSARMSNPGGVANASRAYVSPNPPKNNNISAADKSSRASTGKIREAADITRKSGNSRLNASRTSDNAQELEKGTDSESLRSESVVSNTTEENPELVALMVDNDVEMETSESESVVEGSVEGTKNDEIRAGNVRKLVPEGIETTKMSKRVSATNVTLDSILANLDAKKPGWSSTPMVRLAPPTRTETTTVSANVETSRAAAKQFASPSSNMTSAHIETAQSANEGPSRAEEKNFASTSHNFNAGPSTSGETIAAKSEQDRINEIVDKLIKKPSTIPKLDLKGLSKNFQIPTPSVKQTSMREFLSTLSPQLQKHMNEISTQVGPEVELKRKSVAPKRTTAPRKPRNDDPQPKYVTKANLAFYSKMKFTAAALDSFHAATASFTDQVVKDLDEFLEYKNIPALRNYEDVFELTLFQGLFTTWREYASFVGAHLPRETRRAMVPFDMDLKNSTTSLNWTVQTQKRIMALERLYAQVDDEEDMEVDEEEQ